jgi:Transport and Golgi organisation 2
MCTAVLSIEPGLPVLLAGVRDELADRTWEPPGQHWPSFPGLVGGLDLQAGGTWLAVSPGDRRASCVLNGVGQGAPAQTRQSRGTLPLRAAAGQPLDRARLADTDPFRLLTAAPGQALLQSWDGSELKEQELGPGLHFVVNSGLAADLASAPADRASGPPDGRAHELARIDRFLPLFSQADRPQPRAGQSLADAWGAWLPLVNGDGIEPSDQRALLVRRELGEGRVWGTTSVSLVALATGGVRYDFCSRPGDPSAWSVVL